MTDPTPQSDPAPRESRRRGGAVFGPGGWGRRFTRLWGFLLFAILVVVFARHIITPFVFALLLAYILAPLVHRMSTRPDGSRRMPTGVAILTCYFVGLAAVAVFSILVVPRLSRDAARIGKEAPKLYERLNDEWAPALGAWLEETFPSLRPADPGPSDTPVIEDVPIPPGTAFVATPLPDGRIAMQLQPSGVDVVPRSDGGFTLVPNDEPPEVLRMEDKIRAWARARLQGLQSEFGGLFRVGKMFLEQAFQLLIKFFLMLMVTAFILLDMNRIHGFARGLFPQQYRGDYDAIVAGIDRGLSGVIRGQLIICLVNGVLTYIGLVILGVNYSLVLGIVAGVLSLIPVFGSILSTVPIVLVALVSSDQGIDIPKGALALGWIVLIHFAEANFLNPRIIGTSAKIHPVLVIFALILGEHSYGLVGALLAVPVASIVQVLFLYFRKKTWKAETTSAAT